MSSVPRPSVLLLATVMCVLGAYSPAAGAPFIWDDFQIVRDSPTVSNPGGLSDFFGSAFFSNLETEPGGRSYYRPITVLTWALDHAVHETNPSGYHLTNVLLHALNALLLVGLLRRTGISALAANVGALFWALFPRLTEAVAWISGRTDVLAATWVLLALTLWRPDSWSRRALSSAALFLGLLSKEVALGGVAALAVLELRTPQKSRGARVLSLLPLGAACSAYALLRVSAIQVPLQGSVIPLSRRFTAALEALGRYAAGLVDAYRPDSQIGRLLAPSLPFILLGGLVIVGLAFALPRLWRRGLKDLELAGLAMTAVSLGLVLHLVPLSVNIVAADRFMYLPLLGGCLAIARTVTEALAPLRATLRAAALAALVASLGVATWIRTNDWTDEIDFWTKTYRQHPESNGAAVVELGNLYFRAGLFRHAIGVYQTYRDAGDANYGMIGNNLATALQSVGQYRAARQVLRQVLTVFPNTPKFHVSMAFAELSVANFDESRREFDEALRLLPGYPIARDMKRRLPKLEELEKNPPGDTNRELILRAKHAIDMGRTRDAFKLLDRVLDQGGLPLRETEGALYFALRLADQPTTERVFRAYVAALGRRPPHPAVVAAYRLRHESSQRLLALWPELGVKLPPF